MRRRLNQVIYWRGHRIVYSAANNRLFVPNERSCTGGPLRADSLAKIKNQLGERDGKKRF